MRMKWLAVFFSVAVLCFSAPVVGSEFPTPVMDIAPLPGNDPYVGNQDVCVVHSGQLAEVRFVLDDEHKITDDAEPFCFSFDFGDYPRPHTVRAVGFDYNGRPVAEVERNFNRPLASPLRVEIFSPVRSATGNVIVGATVEGYEEGLLRGVDCAVQNGESVPCERVGDRITPPFFWEINLPDEPAVVTVTATLEGGVTIADDRLFNVGYRDSVAVEEVELYLSVAESPKERGSKTLSPLSRDDIEIREDGELVEIKGFSRDFPVSVGLVLDSSESMVNLFPYLLEPIDNFVENFLQPDRQAMLVGFSGEPYMVTPPSGEVMDLRRGLYSISPFGKTNLAPAVSRGLYLLGGLPGKRAMVLVTDGMLSEDVDLNYVAGYAARENVAVYIIGFDLSKSVRSDFGEIARVTGGRAFDISPEELPSVLERIGNELAGQIQVTYEPASVDDGFRKIKVKAPGKIRTRSGYEPW